MQLRSTSLRQATRPLSRDKLVTALESVFDFGGKRFKFTPRKRIGGHFVEMTVINQSGRLVR